MGEPWSSVKQVAAHLGVVQDSIYHWIDARGLPSHKFGGLRKFKVSEVDAWVCKGGAESREKPMSKAKAAMRWHW